MPRPTKEWIGKTDSQMPPPRVRQRILERENSTCHICHGRIDKPGWHADHVPPLKDGGENRESKIKPVHALCHRRLTAQQAVERAPVERQKQKHSGAWRPKQKLHSRNDFRTRQEKPAKPALPPKQIYEARHGKRPH